jgi:ComF family protein
MITRVPLARVISILRDVVDLVYPTACAACDVHIDSRGPLCADCLSDLRAQEEDPACPLCAKPLAMHGDPCPWCEGKGEPNFERIVRLGLYADPIRHVIYKMKLNGRWALAEFFADRLRELSTVKALLRESDYLVPIPLHRFRQMSRGFNQSEILARRLKKGERIKVVQPLVRIRNTETQTVVRSRSRREENMKHAFGLVSPKQVAGRHVVLIDDIMTTGATLQSAARTLKQAKPASLSVIVIAIADPKGREFEVI